MTALWRIIRALFRWLVGAAGQPGRRPRRQEPQDYLELLRGRPGAACLRCLLNIDSPAQVQTLAGEQTHGIDILMIAQTCARVALVLLGDPRLGDLREVMDPACNFLFLENRRSQADPRGFAPRFLRVPRRRTCPVCGAV